MFVAREVVRVLRAVVGYGIHGRRMGIVALVVLGGMVIALTSAVTTTIPLAIYPFL